MTDLSASASAVTRRDLSIVEVNGEFYAYAGLTLVGIYTLRSRAVEVLLSWE